MVNRFLTLRQCLIVICFCLAGASQALAQQPQPTPESRETFCVPPSLSGSSGMGMGSGAGAPEDAVTIVFTTKEVTKKAEILFNPRPAFTATESASTHGMVRVRVVLCPKGFTSNIKFLSELSEAAAKKALEATQNIRFIPAEKDGKRVAQYATVEYSIEVY
jgi:hypothetical protein